MTREEQNRIDGMIRSGVVQARRERHGHWPEDDLPVPARLPLRGRLTNLLAFSGAFAGAFVIALASLVSR